MIDWCMNMPKTNTRFRVSSAYCLRLDTSGDEEMTLMPGDEVFYLERINKVVDCEKDKHEKSI